MNLELALEGPSPKKNNFELWIENQNAGGDVVQQESTQQADSKRFLEILLKDQGQEAKMTCIKWIGALSDSGAFEDFSLKRLDGLIKEALILEGNLKRQKDVLRQRLQILTKTLQGLEM
ncbi:uncharacterized protein LOC111088605 [Limulus polyphemus]|uniref:Uncharacterized protein LOC111088605 n=1 Tax=Limulus polyphemus TaxID=6850 RepID=A0ABM1TGC5_LIMPO|nr:uncharacterized protein LOC111088605 [Limulus polyphemus]